MVNSVSFPAISDKVFQFNRTAFSVFGLDIQWYGVIICAGVMLAALYTLKRCDKFGTNPDQFIDLLLWALPIAIVGARLYFVLNRWDWYGQNPGEIIKIWSGGLAVYGGVIGGMLTAVIFCRVKKIDPLSILDIGVLGILIGQIIGRWANFVNAEAFGGVTDLVWGMSINGGAPVHPTFLYESLWNFLGFLFLHFYSKRRKFRGEVFLLYLGWYGLGRAWVEGLRSDSLYLGSTDIRISQALAVLCVAASAGLLIYFRVTKKYPKAFATENPAENPIEDKTEDTRNDPD